MTNEKEYEFASPEQLYQLGCARLGVEPKTRKEKDLALLLMAAKVHRSVMEPAVRLLNRILKLRCSEEWCEKVASFWMHYTWGEFLDELMEKVEKEEVK